MKKGQYKDSDYIIYEDGRCYSNKSHKFLTPKMSVKYPTYNLTINGIKKQLKVHRLVAETFIPNLLNKPIVNHIDGDTHNFHVSNLEWATHKENTEHAISMGLMTKNDQVAITIQEALIPDEKWASVIEYPNYLISDHGRIINVVTKRLKKTPLDNNGYPHVNLWKNGKGKTFQVHRLEYQSFYPEANLNGLVINHIDGNKTNNLLNNLELTSYQDNNKQAEYITKTHICSKPVAQFNKNGELIKTYPSISEAERATGFVNISRAIKKHYSTKGYYWNFI